MNIKQLATLFFALCLFFSAFSQTPTGELKRWHKITLDFNGPNTSETANPNPFTDYRLDVTFTHNISGKTYVVPGYYSGCTNPAETSCNSGNVWKVHFAADRIGNWNWTASFNTGNDVAFNGGGNTAGFMDGDTGSFSIIESDKTGRDHRNKDKGRTAYVGEHYLRYVGTGEDTPNGDWFVKAGADAPENTLAYEDFDNTPNRGTRRKNWNPHQQDYNASDASAYTWNNGKGSELLGVVNYLSTKGVNAFSFLTLSLHGDDENVFPHLLKVPINTYNNYNDSQQWNQGVHKDRFDISKLGQWERILEYADKKGMFMHFKTMETENDNIMDGDTFGRERKIYYRELIARFGHHLSLNWNLTEETTMPDAVAIATSNYINNTDPYNHLVVMHTYPNQQTQRYTPLLGNNSSLTGASIQKDKSQVHNAVKEWIDKSRNAGKKWVVANDEQGSANIGVNQDPIDEKLVRHRVLWGTLMAGGAGVEYYYGYQTGETDLTAQNHRSRDVKYTHAGHALDFFNSYLQNDLVYMLSNDGLTTDNNDYAFSRDNEVHVVYRPDGGTTNINLPSGGWDVQWFNPRNGGNLTAATTVNGSITAPSNDDWVALIKPNGTAVPVTSQSFSVIHDSYLQGTTNFNTNIVRIENNNRTGYFMFDVSAFTETITGAQFKFTVDSDSGSGNINLHLGDSNNWTETTLSNTNKPNPTTLLGTYNDTYNLGQTKIIDLQQLTQINSNFLSVILTATSGNDFGLASKENTNYQGAELILFFDNVLSNETNNDIKSLKLFPNPVTGILTINGVNNKDILNVTDLSGRIIISEIKYNNNTAVIDVSHLTNGLYLVTISNRNLALKFVKK